MDNDQASLKRRTFVQWAAVVSSLAACGGGGGGSQGSMAPAPAPGPAPAPAPAPPAQASEPAVQPPTEPAVQPPTEPATQPPSEPAAPPPPPNILQISLDDLNDWVGFLGGHPQVKTPNLDRLAARSHVFEHAYCTVPVCSPARASVLSGLNPRSTGVYDLSTTFKAVNPSKRQFDEMLGAKGYTVMRQGKVDHTFANGVAQPLPAKMPMTNKQCPAMLNEGAFDWGPAVGTEAEQPDHVYAQRVIDFLQTHKGGPFCVSLGMVRTHIAWYVPQRFLDMYPLDKVVLPMVPPDDMNDLGPEAKAYAAAPTKQNFHDCIVKQGLWASAVQAYLASISWVDEQVGRVLDALDASPYAKNTMIVLWSDHGFHMGEKFHWTKLALWEHATRVPFLVSLPGQAQQVRQSACVSMADLAPTVMDYCAVTPDYTMDGHSLRPLLTQPSTSWPYPAVTTLDANSHAVRTGKWRYIRYAGGEQELYDEESDSAEYTNLAANAAYKPVMDELAKYMPAPVKWPA